MVGRYRKKPVTVEALQWTGDNIKEVDQFVGVDVSFRAWDRVLYLYIDEKTHPMNRMDFIIKETNGRVYPCSWETFQETYEEAEPDVYLVGQRGGKTLRWKQSNEEGKPMPIVIPIESLTCSACGNTMKQLKFDLDGKFVCPYCGAMTTLKIMSGGTVPKGCRKLD